MLSLPSNYPCLAQLVSIAVSKIKLKQLSFGGGYDIHLSNYASTNNNSYSRLGHTYNPPRGYSFDSAFAKAFLAGAYHFQPDEIETLYEQI